MIYPRNLANSLQEALQDTPIVCLLGARQCGKSTLVQRIQNNRPYITFDDHNFLQAAESDPQGFIDALPERITLDEIQRVPSLLPAIKLSVDRDRKPGRFLLTGSANLLLVPGVSESLAGRVEFIYLHPLTESEKEQSSGLFLHDFLNGNFTFTMSGKKECISPALQERLIGGGYPEPLTRTPKRSRQWHRQYLKSIIERDIKDIAKVKDGHELLRLLELLALQTGELLNATRLANSLGLNRETIDHYLLVLERLFLIRRLPAWHKNSAKRLIKTAKVHLIDSGLTATLAGLTADDWIDQRDRMGHLLESFVAQQLIAQSGWTDPDLRFWHYRDKDKVEVDLIITKGSKTWGIEIKASASANSSDVKGLTRLARQCGNDFEAGILLYNGHDILPIGNTPFLAVPFNKLWS